MPTKNEIRKTELDLRSLVHSEANEEIEKRLLAFSEFLSADTVFCYFSVRNEIPTDKIIEKALKMGKKVALPVTNDDYSLDFYFISSVSELIKGKFNIPEPKRIEKAVSTEKSICIVPALAVNERGHRVGYGKGCYDRFLKDFKGKAVSLVYERGLTDFPEDKTDIPLYAAITENKAIKF